MANKDLNHVVLIGRLVRDPEIKYTAANKPVAKFSIANNDFFVQGTERKELVSYFDVVVWGNHAVNCEKYLKRGSQVAIGGSLRQNRWTDQNGQNRSKVEIIANSVQFLSPVAGGGGGQGQYGGGQPQDQNYGGAPSNFNQMNNQAPPQNSNPMPEQGGVYQNPWNDDNNNAYIDPYGSNDSDDDIPF